LQFARFLPRVKEKGGHVVFEAPRKLHRLLENFEGIDTCAPIPVTAQDERLGHDVYVFLMSLPTIFGTTLETIPPLQKTINIQADVFQKWRGRMESDKNFKVGIAWAGSSGSPYVRSRSCNLADFLPLADVKGVTFYNLQKRADTAEIEAVKDKLPLVNWEHEW